MQSLLDRSQVDLTPEEAEKVAKVLEIAGGILLTMVERMLVIAKSFPENNLEWQNRVKGVRHGLDIVTLLIEDVVKPNSFSSNPDKVEAAHYLREHLRKDILDLEAAYKIAQEKNSTQN